MIMALNTILLLTYLTYIEFSCYKHTDY